MMKQQLTERFFRYAAVSSQSKGGAGVVPSSAGQRELAELLKKDLQKLGLADLKISEYGVLTGKLPARTPEGFAGKIPTVGFVAHLDTVDVNLSPDVRPQIVKNYGGGDVCLNAEQKIFMKADEHPELKQYVGQDIIFSDGTSVLGADNKAAISSVLVALETLAADASRYHGEIRVAFVPDEEIGLVGAKHMDFSDFPVDFAYTIDCCELGEVVYETFNAAAGEVVVKGVSAHPMSAKGVMVNPTLVAVDLINQFNRAETPEHTEGKEGYIWVQKMSSSQSEAKVTLNIRDHDKKRFEARKAYIKDAVEFLKLRHPKAEIACTITDIYGNIADAVNEENKKCIDYLYAAMHNLGIKPKTIAMRGGTDGSFISTKGILTPNFFTGGHNFHSKFEFLPVDSFEKSCLMVLELTNLIYKNSLPGGK